MQCSKIVSIIYLFSIDCFKRNVIYHYSANNADDFPFSKVVGTLEWCHIPKTDKKTTIPNIAGLFLILIRSSENEREAVVEALDLVFVIS